MTILQWILTVASGGIIGFPLGLIGGGSILAVPLLLYVVGVKDPHIVIGSTALAVSINAFLNLIPHSRSRPCSVETGKCICYTRCSWSLLWFISGQAFTEQAIAVSFCDL
ncbi:TSUP family transporter [Peribacillus frigoritolerans]|uniref:TSUP family transporter n=1 Tax=Peribacillus frigoritolerans TaxID=450367 RepID=UPI002417E91B|nr:TSUP family transporter [Peribacillus frigoritolerans]MDG4850010.1 TSUP family transporter [Peribacillus frigoritolerans]WHX69060.1 TSUP family transporter [Peribacillus frigoritolerans]